MAKIQLRKYQEDAVKFALRVPKCLLCMRVGSGKTVCAMFSLRSLFKKKLIDKAVIACTKSSVSVFVEDFKEKAGMDVPVIEDPWKFVDFLKSDGKVCIVKHSMLQKAGNDFNVAQALAGLSKKITTALVIDEAHKIQNTEGVIQDAFHHIDFFFKRMILLTATPYSSCLSQFYGLICIMYPKLWRTKTEFFNKYIDEISIKDPRTHRIVRKEKVRYKNLKDFREKILPFTYFYFPPIPLVYIEHKTRLKDYTEYDDLCKGILPEE